MALASPGVGNKYEIQNNEEQNEVKTKEAENFNFSDNFNDHEMEMEMEQNNFQTSTPKKRKYECEDCANQSECVECIVKHYEGKMVV